MSEPAPSRRHYCAHCGLPVAAKENASGPLFCCYGCYLVSRIVGRHAGDGPRAWDILRLGVGAFLAMNVMMVSILLYTGQVEAAVVPIFRWLLLGLATPATALLAYPFAVGAAAEIAKRRLSLDTLLAAGSLSAFGVSAVNVLRGQGHIYFDTATMLPVLVTFGRVVEAAAKSRAGSLMDELAALLPRQAERIEDGSPRAVDAKELRRGDRLLVRPGAVVPADGVIVEGRSTLLEAAFTGESGPRPCREGDRVLAGTVNQEGPLVVEAREVGEGLLLARIIEMVREARQQTSPSERSAQKAAAVFAPATLALAAAAGIVHLAAGDPARGLLSALAVLVVACPCAMGIATPLAVALGLARAARQGVLLRSGEALERAGQVDTVFFDKTGTLTRGELELAAVEPADGTSKEELLGMLAAVESRSEHALARSIARAAQERKLQLPEARAAATVPGRGVRGEVLREGRWVPVVAGSEEFVRDSLSAQREAMNSLASESESRPIAMDRLWGPGTGTSVFMAWDGVLKGRAVLSDTLRPDARETVAALRAMGVRCVLLSGDRAASAGEMARQAGIEQVEAPCLPHEKLARVRAASDAGHVAAMVGDGINDAPALAAADVGVAVGVGADLARQAGSAVLPGDRLAQVPWLLELGRRTRLIIRQNLAWAFGYNAVAIAAAACGVLHPLLAAIAMVVSSLTVLTNSLRLRR